MTHPPVGKLPESMQIFAGKDWGASLGEKPYGFAAFQSKVEVSLKLGLYSVEELARGKLAIEELVVYGRTGT